MKVRSLTLAAALVALAVVTLPAAPEPASPATMPVSAIRPGMVGIGRTVFQGAALADFKVHILGVLANVIGPRRNLILARLEGGPLADTGVIAGMSGSPVYIDGKLIGAVSYALGSFSKAPIAGITPIGEMTDSAHYDGRRAVSAAAALRLPLTPEGVARALRAAVSSWAAPFASDPADIRADGASGLAGMTAGQVGSLLRPIATPLVMSGFDPSVGSLVADALRSDAFLPVSAGSAAQAAVAAAHPLQPGDAIGVNLVSGDLSLGGVGTVTAIENGHVYAFGHPLYNLGPTEFPMTRAYVYTILPSLYSSTKIAATTDVIGTFQQDRATAISGTLGPGPALIPIHVSLKAQRGPAHEFQFQVVRDQLFTPLMTYASILNTLASYERQYGAATFSVKGTATLKGHGEIHFEDMFTGDQPSVGAAAYIVGPLTFLLKNDYEPVEIQGLNISITSTEEPRTARLERIWLDGVRPRPGTTVPLKVLLRTFRGEEIVRTVAITIPAWARGHLSLLVSAGSRLAQIEQRQGGSEPHSIGQIVRELNDAPKNNRLYVQLLNSDPGAVVNGERLQGLPPSVLDVLASDRSNGSFAPLGSATIGEWELSTDYAVSGSRVVALDVGQD
ncbi:MAG: hypothetical protein KGN76_13530 [Acidobacteriota bacterium]|nr:hypothetical protein [Acidobacteriota bacterium]